MHNGLDPLILFFGSFPLIWILCPLLLILSCSEKWLFLVEKAENKLEENLVEVIHVIQLIERES